MIDIAAIKLRYEAVSPVLDERGRRRFAAAEALTAGWGGITAVSEATGIARSTIGYGLRDADRLARLLDRIGPAIVVTRSASGPAGWLIADQGAGQRDGLLDPGVHPLPSGRAADVGRIAAEERLAAARAAGHAMVDVEARSPGDVHDAPGRRSRPAPVH